MKVKRFCLGVYEASFQVELTQDGKTETAPAVATISRRSDEVGGWMLEIVAKRPDGREHMLCNAGDEHYFTKREIVQSLEGPVLKRWEYNDSLRTWCI